MGPILVRGQATLRQQLALSLSPRLQRLEQLHFLASILNAGRKEESGALSLALRRACLWQINDDSDSFYGLFILAAGAENNGANGRIYPGRNYGPTLHSKTQLRPLLYGLSLRLALAHH